VLSAEQVRVVTREAGATRVGLLREDERDAVREGLLSLGELLMMGDLYQPELLPLDQLPLTQMIDLPTLSAGCRPQPKGVGAELASARGSASLGGSPGTGGDKLLPYTRFARGVTILGSSRSGRQSGRALFVSNER
jgi:hypothetical protein